ncbi:23 kDa integral membrane protein-like [Leptopilina heterotoma]|uniref:23 kDa integral membrane protein-like n=1 Tax=Leptopilina heterotoma TaxID=63436 RepID=UPI001CA7DB01|nr:23 kDa integral membrane protein-like [Leptopilina heterotoma]
MARSFGCLRYLLLSCVVFFGIIGIIVSVTSGYSIYRLYEYAPLTPNKVCGPAIILLGMGILSILLAWWAYYSVDHNNLSPAVTFSFFLGLITLVEFSTGIWSFVKHEEINEIPAFEAKKAFSLAITDHKKLWDRMQSKLGCCGLYGPSDYRDKQGVPWSCHKASLTNDAENPYLESFYKIGCLYSAHQNTRSVLLSLFLTSLGSVILQVCFLAVTTCYSKAIKKKKEKRKQDMIDSARNRSVNKPDNHMLKPKALPLP